MCRLMDRFVVVGIGAAKILPMINRMIDFSFVIKVRIMLSWLIFLRCVDSLEKCRLRVGM